MVAERVERMRKLAAGRGPHAALRHPLPRHHPPHLGRGVGRRRRAARRACRPRRSPPRRPTSPPRSPRASAAWPSSAAPSAISEPRSLEIYPNVWAGIGLVRGGAGTALVGSFDRGRRPHRASTPTSASTSSSCRATRTSRRPAGSARACCRCCATGACVAPLDVDAPPAPRCSTSGEAHGRASVCSCAATSHPDALDARRRLPRAVRRAARPATASRSCPTTPTTASCRRRSTSATRWMTSPSRVSVLDHRAVDRRALGELRSASSWTRERPVRRHLLRPPAARHAARRHRRRAAVGWGVGREGRTTWSSTGRGCSRR